MGGGWGGGEGHVLVRAGLYTVQIPLWTIVTEIIPTDAQLIRCSDSSMDDCNNP